MIVLAGGNVVLPDRVLLRGSVVIDEGRVVDVDERTIDGPSGAARLEIEGHTVVPGFIDVHVHGVDGFDVLDGGNAVESVAAHLPRYGVTAFCPTSVACTPTALEALLGAVRRARAFPAPGAARVLPAHLESNFINPAWKGAQPEDCIREFRPRGGAEHGAFTGDAIISAIEAARDEVAIVTTAPEMDGGLELVRELHQAGHIVSIGHTGASYEQANAAIAVGVTHATHLFNRMTPLSHREPGVVGAVLASPAVAAEVICDAYHVHPAVVAMAIAAKGIDRVMAITDGTAGAGLSIGSRTRLGGRTIVVKAHSAELDDGTLAGSILTMDGAFRMLVRQAGMSLVDAARLCSTSPAAQLALPQLGRIEVGATADLVVLDEGLLVTQTYIGGVPALEP
jgi:N-acetylglucosamine-6-phosphate deacetylase